MGCIKNIEKQVVFVGLNLVKKIEILLFKFINFNILKTKYKNDINFRTLWKKTTW